ncbi:MAG TPA: hypothetical protein VKZ53_02585 [Candidatus Angelobacter sp.]|nr:hypothetical protein [Candidatus Angelobacter sp.]
MRATNNFTIFCGIALLISGCTRQQWGAIAARNPVAIAQAPAKLMLFGGLNHKTYLGCLNCSEYVTDSISNEYGIHGSSYSSDSIKNHYSEYGSAYSTYSACNQYASDPPVIVDSNGIYYGRLTLNEYHSQIGVGRDYTDWLKVICEQ